MTTLGDMEEIVERSNKNKRKGSKKNNSAFAGSDSFSDEGSFPISKETLYTFYVYCGLNLHVSRTLFIQV